MTTIPGPASPGPDSRPDLHRSGDGAWRAWAFGAGSIVVHAGLVAALVVPWPAGRPAAPPPPQPMGAVEVVMIQQADTSSAAPAAAAPQPAPPADGEAAPRPAAPPPTMQTAVNLGGDPAEPWNVRSDTLKPPAPDARFRNLPPRYPAEAASRRESGTVELLVHVAVDGTADAADIVGTSGSASLDREARRAVLLWHFDPARQDGAAVPFAYPISIHFTRN